MSKVSHTGKTDDVTATVSIASGSTDAITILEENFTKLHSNYKTFFYCRIEAENVVLFTRVEAISLLFNGSNS